MGKGRTHCDPQPMRFADLDVVTLAATPEQLKVRCPVIIEAFQKIGIRLNLDMTVGLVPDDALPDKLSLLTNMLHR